MMSFMDPKSDTGFKKLERMSWTHADKADYIREQDSLGYEQRVIQGAIEQATKQEKQANAINALKNGLDFALIATITGLSIEEIQALNKKIQ